MELAWTHTAKKRRQHCQTSFAVENHKATEEDGNHGILGEEIGSQNWEQQDSSTVLEEDGGGG